MSTVNPCKEIDLGVHDEIKYLSRKIREALGINHIGVPDSNLSREMIEKLEYMRNLYEEILKKCVEMGIDPESLLNREREYMRNLNEELLKKKCVEMGIDPESLHVDWNSMKWGEEK
jgi:hypothetical protein